MINIDKQIQYWKEGADSDLDTAEILIENGKYLQGLFFCHLCIEKILKALFVKENKEIPPKSHDLFYLANKSKILIPEDKMTILQVLMRYQLEGRYPQLYPKSPKSDTADKYFNSTKSILLWLGKKL